MNQLFTFSSGANRIPLLISAILTITVIACNSTQKKRVETQSDTLNKRNTISGFWIDTAEVGSDYKAFKSDTIIPVVKIKDPNQYSGSFIEGLSKFQYSSKYELLDSMLIVGELDTFYFPTSPQPGKTITLIGRKENLAIALHVKRVNYTTIEYNLEMVEFGKATYNHSGRAHLSHAFFIGAESDEDSMSGETYLSNEYVDSKNEDSPVHIRLSAEDSNNRLKGKLIKINNGKIRNIGLEDFVTLVEK